MIKILSSIDGSRNPRVFERSKDPRRSVVIRIIREIRKRYRFYFRAAKR